MNRIICRFESERDLNRFNEENKTNLSKDMTYFNFKTMECKIKRKLYSTSNESLLSLYRYGFWKDMPEFISNNQEVYAKIVFDFEDDLNLANIILQQNITQKTKSVWFPKLIQGKHSSFRVIGGKHKAQYPIYVVSKGRWDKCSTSIFLSNMEQPHFVVVEPNEAEVYKQHIENKYCKILELDMSYKDNYDTFDDLGDTKGKGPGGARNFCWEHSIKLGFKYHWVMDDNANEGFFYMWRNKKIKCRTPEIFYIMEEFVDRFDNIAIAGTNYSKFCFENSKYDPFTTNTRIYSFLLIRNDIPYRWRGRYNEDTDLSLRVLKDGWCTLQFNCFLAGKLTTQRIGGGNTDEFYSSEGTLPKSEMLEKMHPDVAKVVWKFNRWHHQVDYSKYNQKLQYKDFINIDWVNSGINFYDMKIINTKETSTNDTKSYLENKYKDNENLLYRKVGDEYK